VTASNSSKSSGRIAQDIVVYVCILAIAGLQFVVAYSNLSSRQMVVCMLVLAIIEASLGVLFFMHLKAENRAFVVSVAVITLFVLAAMQYSWTDSFRLITCGGKCS
jgi:heme/copper-type cytochrome/quinol oxidase subunit 4